MLIATLPTMISGDSMRLGIKILSHPLINAVRYNTGGESPYTPDQILSSFSYEAKRLGKKLYVDLDGRQTRVARWTPFERGVVVLNQDFEIKLPGQIYFRGLGWFEMVSANPKERKIFFNADDGPARYYLGESQSVHIVAKNFRTLKYLSDRDYEFIKAAADAGIDHFMLSFVESGRDIYEFYAAYNDNKPGRLKEAQVVLKIESIKGVKSLNQAKVSSGAGVSLMAARDDLFLAYKNRRAEFLEVLGIIIGKNPNAILASKIMSGLEYGSEVTLGDMADLVLMSQMGYKNFMFSDEITKNFDWAMENWQEVMIPLLSSQTKKQARQ